LTLYLYKVKDDLDKDYTTELTEDILKHFSNTYQCNNFSKYMYFLLIKILENEYNINKKNIKFCDSGKPYIDGNTIHISLTNHYPYIGILISENECGVDIEIYEKKDDYLAVASKIFAAKYYDNIVEAKDPIKLFYQYYVKLEAISKLKGEGLIYSKLIDTQLENSMILEYDNIVIGIAPRSYVKVVNRL